MTDILFAILMGAGVKAGLVITWVGGQGSYQYVEFGGSRIAWRRTDLVLR